MGEGGRKKIEERKKRLRKRNKTIFLGVTKTFISKVRLSSLHVEALGPTSLLFLSLSLSFSFLFIHSSSPIKQRRGQTFLSLSPTLSLSKTSLHLPFSLSQNLVSNFETIPT